MRVSSRHTWLFTVVGLGVAALVLDRAVLLPSGAQAATAEAPPPAAASSAAPAPPSDPLPPSAVSHLARRLDALDAPSVTPDIFRADPAEWGLPAPGATERHAEVELRLTAIMNADASGADNPASCAVINSRIVRVGQAVAGFTVEAITPAAVRLRRGEQTRELRLGR